MDKAPLWSCIALLALAAPAAATEGHRVRTLTGDPSTAAVRRVELRLPPGSVRIEPSPDDRLRIELDIHCAFDNARCEERAERLTLDYDRRGSTLHVRVDGLSALSAIGINVRGRVQVPRGKAVEVDLPAGELKIRGVRGDLAVDVGAGEVSVALSEADVRSVRVRVGIGEASLSVGGRRIEGSGWLGHKVRWHDGSGPSEVAVNLGVGELDVRLD